MNGGKSPVLETRVKLKRRALVGEGPHWDGPNNRVLWVDIGPGIVWTTDYTTLETTKWTHNEMVGAAIPRAGGGMFAAVESGFLALNSDWAVEQKVDVLTSGFRMNDAKTDPAGRVWSGSTAIDFAPKSGGLWRIDEHWNPTLELSGLTLPNGMGWSPDQKTMYLADSIEKVILEFSFDPVNSAIVGGPNQLIGPDSFIGVPDGLTVDRRGHLWIADFGGARVTEFSADGLQVSTVNLPTAQPTSCAFVGPQMDTMWVTSASTGLDEVQDPVAGSILELTGFDTVGFNPMRFNG